jgi:hypothetical protein
LWMCRPTAGSEPTPESAVVRAAAWAAWSVTTYLTLGCAALVVARMRGGDGRWVRAIGAVLPAAARRAVDVTVGTSVVLGVGLGPGVTAATADDAGAPISAAETIAALDWGRTAAAGPVTVRAGDSLWAIAARSLGPAATDADVAVTWPRWWAANRPLIGPDPDVLRPGQHLRPPFEPHRGPHGRHD